MGKLWAISAREFLERVRNKWFIIVTIFGPIFFGTIMILPGVMQVRAKASTDIARITILDASGVGLGKRISDYLNRLRKDSIPLTKVRVLSSPQIAAAESVETKAVMAKQSTGYLVVDSSTLHGVVSSYAGRNASAVSDMEELQRTIRRQVLAARLAQSGLPASAIDSITKLEPRLNSQRITDEGRGGSGMVSIIFGAAISIVLYMTIMIYGQNILSSVIEEKQTRVAEIVISSVSAVKLLAGKVIGVGAVSLVQLLIWLSSSWVLFKFKSAILLRLGVGADAAQAFQMPAVSVGMIVLLALFFVFGFAFYASLFAAAGSMVNTPQEAQQVLMPVILMLVGSVVFLGPIMQNPSGTLATVISLLPFSAPIIMPLRLAAVPVSPLEIAASLAVLALATGGALWLAGRIYRVGLLMYGKRPSMMEIAHWVRQSQ